MAAATPTDIAWEPDLIRKHRLLLAGLCTLLLLGGCGTEPVTESRPLIKIGDRQIVKTEFETLFLKTARLGPSLAEDERRELERAFVNQLIDQELVFAEIRRRGITIPQQELTAALDEQRRDYPPGGVEAMLQERGLTLAEWQDELTRSLLVGRLIDQVVGERHRVSAAEIDAYYEAHRADYDRPEQVRARQILVADRAAGEELLARLLRGESFAALAGSHSLSPEAEQGGDLGFFGRDELPPEFAAVFALPVGSVSPLVKSDYGYHLFLVEEKRPAARLTRAEAEREIRRRLETDRRETVYQEWLQELRGRAAIEVDWTQLAPPEKR